MEEPAENENGMSTHQDGVRHIRQAHENTLPRFENDKIELHLKKQAIAFHVKIKGPPRTFLCTAQIIWNPGSAAASPTPAESSTQPAEKQSVYGEESRGRMLMSQKKPYLCVPLDAIRVEAIPQKQCYNKKDTKKCACFSASREI